MSEGLRRRQQEPSAFLERKLAEGAQRFSLFVLGVDGSRTYCDAWPASAGFAEVRDSIEEKAARVAATGPSVCNFMVTAEGARDVDGKAPPLGFETFRVSAQAASTGGQLLSEPANEAGLLAQLMRHNEATMKTSFTLQGLLFEQQASTIREQREQLAALEAKRLETYQLVEDLLSLRHERELDTYRTSEGLKLKGKAVESFVKLLPIAADAVMGKVHPQGAALTSANLARELFNSLKQEQLMAVLQQLTPEQGAQVLRLFQVLAKQEQPATEGEKDGAESSQTQH